MNVSLMKDSNSEEEGVNLVRMEQELVTKRKKVYLTVNSPPFVTNHI